MRNKRRISSLIAALFLLCAVRANAAISFVAEAHNTAASSPIACNVPTGTTDGNFMVWFYSDETITSPSQNCPTGWSFLRTDQSATTNVQGILCYRVASSEPASYTFTGGHAGETCGISTFSGAVGIGANTGSNDFGTPSGTLIAPTLTTTANNSVVLANFAWAAGTNQALTMFYTTAFNITNTQATPNAGLAMEYVAVPIGGTTVFSTTAGTAGNVSWSSEQVELLASGPTPTVTPTPTMTPTPTVTATPTPIPNPVCNVGGNVLKINGSPAVSQRVVFDTYSLQNQGGSLTPSGKFSVNTDAFGNLPNPTNVPEGLVVFLTVGAGQPVRIQIPNATSANLSQLVAANNGPASLVTGVAATGPGSSGISITNPPLGGIGISTINFNGSAIPGVNPGTTGQILIQGPLDPAFYTLTGDIACSTSAPGLCTVVGIQDTPVSPTAPTTGQSLVFNGSQYVPSTVTGNVINVMSYNCKGNSTGAGDGNDDSTCINTAIDACHPGQLVYFPWAPGAGSGGCYRMTVATHSNSRCGGYIGDGFYTPQLNQGVGGSGFGHFPKNTTKGSVICQDNPGIGGLIVDNETPGQQVQSMRIQNLAIVGGGSSAQGLDGVVTTTNLASAGATFTSGMTGYTAVIQEQDRTGTDGATVQFSPTFTSAAGNFTTAVTGGYLTIFGAGAANQYGQPSDLTYPITYASSTTLTMPLGASVTITGTAKWRLQPATRTALRTVTFVDANDVTLSAALFNPTTSMRWYLVPQMADGLEMGLLSGNSYGSGYNVKNVLVANFPVNVRMLAQDSRVDTLFTASGIWGLLFPNGTSSNSTSTIFTDLVAILNDTGIEVDGGQNLMFMGGKVEQSHQYGLNCVNCDGVVSDGQYLENVSNDLVGTQNLIQGSVNSTKIVLRDFLAAMQSNTYAAVEVRQGAGVVIDTSRNLGPAGPIVIDTLASNTHLRANQNTGQTIDNGQNTRIDDDKGFDGAPVAFNNGAVFQGAPNVGSAIGPGFWFQISTRSESSGNLPFASITVDSTATFAASGTINLDTGQTITYTSKDATHFLGCTGGTGFLFYGSLITQGGKVGGLYFDGTNVKLGPIQLNATTGAMTIFGNSTSVVPIFINAQTGQTADIADWAAGGPTLASVDAKGNFLGSNLVPHVLTGTTPVGVCASTNLPSIDIQTYANTASPTLITLPCTCKSGEILTWHIHQTSSGGTITLPAGTVGPFTAASGACSVVGTPTFCTLGTTQSPPSDLDANFQLDGTVWRLETCNPF
jgi:hypothetical protein